MAALSITAANVLGSAYAERRSQYKAAAAITAGQLVYLNASSQWALVDSNASLGTLTTDVLGIAENSAPGAGQPLTVVISDSAFVIGVATTAGATVYGSIAPGGITIAEIPTTGEKPIVVGIMSTTLAMVLRPFGTGVQI
jgi:hypothetical protein